MEEYIFCPPIAMTHSLLGHTTPYNTLIVNISTEPLRRGVEKKFCHVGGMYYFCKIIFKG